MLLLYNSMAKMFVLSLTAVILPLSSVVPDEALLERGSLCNENKLINNNSMAIMRIIQKLLS